MHKTIVVYKTLFYVYNIYNHIHFLSFICFIFQDSLAAMFELDKISVHAIVAKMIISEELMASMDEPTECKNFKIKVFQNPYQNVYIYF